MPPRDEPIPDLTADPRPPRPPAPPKERPRRRRRGPFGGIFRFLFTLAAVGLVAGGVAAFGLYRHIAADLPDYRWLADYQPPQMSRIYAADSRLLAELASERRIFIPIEAIPKRLQAAFVSAEDQRFWEHHGVDPMGILRAVITNIEQYGTGRRMGGASTITQQVAKNMLVGADRTMMRKAREAILAIRIEEALPKERILELYLNEIFLGYQAYGVAAAAQAYFNKGLDELTLGEIGFLGALPKAPNNYNPLRYPEAARARRDWVLDRMAEDGAVTREEAQAAKAEPIVPRPLRRPEVVPVGQYFTEEVRRDLISRFGAEQTTQGGLVVRTSMDPALQAATEGILRGGLAAYDRRRGGWRGPVARISAGATDWMPQLEAVQRPGGVLPEWKLAVALEVRPGEARLGWVERPDPRLPAQPRSALLALDDAAWARKALGEGRLGPAPRRMQDVLAVGDVVPVEVIPGTPAQGRVAARPERLALRQVPQVEGAIVALDPATGRVLAMAGGWSFDKSQFNRATQAQRQPGSSFKPFVYLPALEAGVPPNQRFLDGPIEVMTAQGPWRPSNYTEGSYNGYVTIRTALQKSLNLVTVRVAQEVGMAKVAETAARFGVIDAMPKYLAMSLGSGETTVLRMAAGYAGFASGGRRVTPTFIDSVQDRRGKVVWRSDARACEGCAAPAPSEEPPALVDARPEIADPIAAYQMTNILTGVVQRGTGMAAGKGLNRPIAGKTGTTNDYVDNWFVGYTPDIVIAVWLGFDEPRSLGKDETGGQNAAPIFREVLQAALKDSPPVPFRAPPGVALVRMQDGNATILEAFRPGTENSARPVGGESGGGTAAGADQSLGGLY
ncbi:penicillin-binding protein 1A [Paracraurococcus lichenis]|uniref:Penicillin-binding protein 1A n=1 Tax=Paracraurococcus lichenis TaxID=3064888 RepID=A0ABT9DVT8_9PROT|nr:PBP1A family penicillin-binding protein [Paracraurococcus sp. LOR1-02]MDO9708012.1 PBP1A family penicillin-binding protein [Paracraurococcus sp. LOR1-02]